MKIKIPRKTKFNLSEILHLNNSFLNQPLSFNFGMGKEKEYFFENLSMLIQSQASLISSLRVIREEVQTPKMRRMLKNIETKVQYGTPFWQAMKETGMFSDQIVSLIRIGEKTGKLPQNLNIIALQEEKNRQLKAKISSATLYPALVFGVTIFVGTGVTWFVLPRLTSIFNNLRIDLPLITRIIIAIGDFLDKYGIIAVPMALFLFSLTTYIIFFNPKTKFVGQKILFRMPVIKKLIKEIELARFGFTLGSFLDAGIPITSSLRSLCETTSSPDYRKYYQYLHLNVGHGNSLQKCFKGTSKTSTYIPAPIQQVIITAEQSGTLAAALYRINEKFESKVDNTTKNLAILLEPILLVIVWAGVFIIALAIIMPIYSMVGGLK